jgi:transposase InsO family protein
MSYTTNPQLPKLRMRAVLMVRRGQSVRAVARYFGYSHSTVSRWVARAPFDGRETIPTLRSRPKSHPKQLPEETVAAIVEERLRSKRCSEVIHQALADKGVVVSLSSVKRTLARHELLKTRTWHRAKRRNIPRPEVTGPGDLLQVDTVHLLDLHGNRWYLYTLIDLYSRWVHVEACLRISQAASYEFLTQAQRAAPFVFRTVQADNGPEFGRSLHDRLKANGITLRHSRVRRSNDNAHIERFNRTIQEECLGRWPNYQDGHAKVADYVRYYNTERLHLGIELKRPADLLTQVC